MVSTAFEAKRVSHEETQIETLVHTLYERQARATPHAVALVSESGTVTFAEMYEKVCSLAAYLRTLGVGPDSLVGVFLERDCTMVVAIMAVLHAGGAYVPLDPDYPADRLEHILGDASPKLVITQRSLRARLSAEAMRVLSIDAEWGGEPHASPELGDQRPDQLAYVIYTSGSTGRPQGVMIEHGHVVQLWLALEEIYRTCPACHRVALNASISFDASVQQLVQLLSGRALFVISAEARRDPARLLRLIEEQSICAIDCTPSQLKSWITAGLLRNGPSKLRVVLVGGEAIEPELWAMLATSSDIRFFNVYGPTECTVDVTAALLNGDTSSPHVGRPMRGRRIYVLGKDQEPLAPGIHGEIYIGGTGVARGYLRRPEATRERFLQDPFTTGGRMYKTGDIGSFRADGILEFHGREDSQVKIRGHRVELGEIESQLRRHPQVRDAVVVMREEPGRTKRVVAYVVTRDRGSPHAIIESLRQHVTRNVPEFMVPADFVLLANIPLSPSGKIDRRALPAPNRPFEPDASHEEPEGIVERTLAETWRTVLGVGRVGRNDDFFKLGGDSLLLIELLQRIRQLGFTADVGLIFRARTLHEMATVLQANMGNNVVPTTRFSE
jgi:myxalamid-type nonribosomal peptide synthetase MxaA